MCHELVCVTNLCVDADKKAAQDEAFAFDRRSSSMCVTNLCVDAQDEAFAFDRTASRLQDMMSESH